MCRIHSWSRFDIDLWPHGQIYRFLSFLQIQPVTSVCYDIGLPYLAHVSITMRGCVKYIQDPERMLTFDLMVKFVGFMTWLFVRATAFLSFDSLIMIGTWVYHHGIMCRIHTWPWTSLSKLYFNHEFESGKIVFALWHKHTKFWHMVVSPWENMLCTFLTFVWPWPLTYMCRGYP